MWGREVAHSLQQSQSGGWLEGRGCTHSDHCPAPQEGETSITGWTWNGQGGPGDLWLLFQPSAFQAGTGLPGASEQWPVTAGCMCGTTHRARSSSGSGTLLRQRSTSYIQLVQAALPPFLRRSVT